MAGKSNGVESDWARAPPPSRPACQRLARVVYNPDEKSFLGRTPKKWGIVLTFYVIFYSVLALLFAACMAGLFTTIDPTIPSHILEDSLIGVNPGVAFRPISPDLTSTQPVLRYAVENISSYDYYTNSLMEFLEPYTSRKMYADQEGCNSEDNFGYPKTPCFFIKLNKIYGWEPDNYNATDLDEDMPEDLVSYIKNTSSSTEPQTQQIWISCWEEQSNDTQIEYPWGRGLPSTFFPYFNTKDYLSPLLAIRITPPVETLVIIRCRAWAKNIIYSKSIKEPRGYTRILLWVEETVDE